MYKRISLLLFFACMLLKLHAQVGIGTTNPHGSAKLEIQSTTQGLLLPRMTASQREAIQSPAQGLLVFQTNGTIGIYYYDGNLWRNMTTGFIPESNGMALKQNNLVSTIAGSSAGFSDGPGLSAQFNTPYGVAIDGSGNVYVADYNNHRIRKIDAAAGTVTTLAGSTFGFVDDVGSAAKFSFPTGVAVDGSGNVYVADFGNHLIRKINASGSVTTLAGSTQGFTDGAGTVAQFNNPANVAVDGSGNVYVADFGNHKIRKIDAAGSVTTLAGSTQGFADGIGSIAQFSFPTGVAVDVNGNVYVVDRNNNKIRKIDAAGTVTTLAGSTRGFTDGQASVAKFDNPFGVAVDGSGNVYVGDRFNHKIRKIDASGTVTTFAGSAQGFADGAGSAAKFNIPAGVAVDGRGYVYVTDQSNYKIRKIVF